MESILTVYPKAKDCVDGHIGAEQRTVYEQTEDDRVVRKFVYRCSWCNMPTGREEDWEPEEVDAL